MCKTDTAVGSLHAHPMLETVTTITPFPSPSCASLFGQQQVDIPSSNLELVQLLQALKEKEQILNWRESQLVEREHEVQRQLMMVADRKLNVSNTCSCSSKEEDDGPKDVDQELRAYWRAGKFIKSLVFGGLDGLTTTLALICSAVAAGEDTVSTKGILILGVATLFADAFSMGIGDFLSSMAEGDVLHNKASHALALRNGLVMFLAFVSFGGLPLLAFLPQHYHVRERFRLSCLLCAACLFTLGSIKGRLEGQRMLLAGVTMMILGSIASILSYYVSNGIHVLL
eukprot:TRINITY_DN69662_c0_g1_i1.p1 TRINITY_DN69662_c0_g1~~TRINITY_DN69662_c0_g1_i1.p1  ORF type:complete len:292 (+),score=43.86 TRINITY_DN69662_c0_g1_i1:23-877(+)